MEKGRYRDFKIPWNRPDQNPKKVVEIRQYLLAGFSVVVTASRYSALALCHYGGWHGADRRGSGETGAEDTISGHARPSAFSAPADTSSTGAPSPMPGARSTSRRWKRCARAARRSASSTCCTGKISIASCRASGLARHMGDNVPVGG